MSGDHLKDHTEGWSGSDWGVGGGGGMSGFYTYKEEGWNGVDL